MANGEPNDNVEKLEAHGIVSFANVTDPGGREDLISAINQLTEEEVNELISVKGKLTLGPDGEIVFIIGGTV